MRAMQPDPTVTLIIAVVGLVLSASSFTWQLVQFFLSGRRVVAELRVAALGRGAMVTAPTGSDVSELAAQGMDKLGMAVVARNLGRAPAQIDGFAVEFSSGATFTQAGMAINPSLPFTLNAGEKVDFFVPVEGVRAAAAIEANKGRFRAVVTLGTGQTKRSVWSGARLP